MLFVALICVLAASTAGTERLRTVYPVIMEERSGDAPLMLRIHHGLTLSLTKASVASEVLRLRSYLNGNATEKIVQASEIEETLFEDKTNLATLSLVKGPDGVRVTELLSATEKIEPALYGARRVSGGLPHIVRSIQRPLGSRRVMHESRKDNGPRNCTDKSIPNNVTVEVYVVSDYPHNRRFEDHDFLLYICIFMNSVNTIFMSMSCPDVRLILVGAEKTDQNRETAYVFGLELMNDMTSLHLFRNYASGKKAEYGYPDIVLLLTGRDLYESTGRGPNRNVSGRLGAASTSFIVLIFVVP